ncbi:MAG: HEPN domain-containing protein [Treponemataceae bacterium]|nr:MAG: HEPN domain-containing protein [Treponemataceae bacterium]
MSDEEKYSYWLEYAEYDLQTAGDMFATGRWMYVVFMCQQAIEKLVKGLYLLYNDDDVPRTHDISSVISRFMDKLPQPVSDERLAFFRRLSSYYLNTRYPEYKERLNKITNKDMAAALFEQTKDVFEWLLTLKP